MTAQTLATAEIEKWIRIRVRFFPNFWLRFRVRKKNAESFRSRLRQSGFGPTSVVDWWDAMVVDWCSTVHDTSGAEVVLNPVCRNRLRQDSALFVRIRIRTRGQKFVKKQTQIRSHFSISAPARVQIRSHFSISAPARVCGHFLSKTGVNYSWIDDCSWSLNRSRILKFEKLSNPDPVRV